MPPETAASPSDAKSAPLPLSVPMEPKRAKRWLSDLHDSEEDVKTRERDWKDQIQAYMGKVLKDLPKDHVVSVPLTFAYVELKKAQLAFQVPELHLTAKRPEFEGAVPVFQAALNHELGPENGNVSVCLDECLSDVLMTGIAFSKVGYQSIIRTRQKPVMEPDIDPLTSRPRVDAQGQPQQRPAMQPQTDAQGAPIIGPDGQPAMQPVMQDEQYVAYEEYFWTRFETERGLVPRSFKGSDFDRAPWLAMKFWDPVGVVKSRYKLPDDFPGGNDGDLPETLAGERPPDASGEKRVKGYEVWYYPALTEAEATADVLPPQMRRLVFFEGRDAPVVHEDSPYQWLDEESGKVLGMEGNPINVMTLRFLPGSAYPVSDVGISLPLVEELTMGRSQMLRFRDRVLPIRGYDRTLMDPETLSKLEAGDIGDWVGFDGNPEEILSVIAPNQYQRENFTFDEVVKRDHEQVWSMGRNGGLQLDPQSQTATEANIGQSAADVRLDKERTAVLTWFTRGGRKYASLLQQFKDDVSYAPIVGEDGVQQLKAWNRHTIPGEFVYKANPDSALRMDADVQRRQTLGLYNQVGRDPNVRRVELLKKVFQRFNIDPSKIVVETPPQEPKPEPPKISLSIKAEDIIVAFGVPGLATILQQAGITLQPQQPPAPPGAPVDPSAAQSPPHPGAVPAMEPINKHQLTQDVGQVLQ